MNRSRILVDGTGIDQDSADLADNKEDAFTESVCASL